MNNNRNMSVRWAYNKSNIFIDKRILDYNNPIIGIYGIFIGYKYGNKKCVYVGRSGHIYNRMFKGSKSHISKIRKNEHLNLELNKVNEDIDVKVFVEILEHVNLVFDDYCKDMQRLASAENYHINKYQSRNQCLNQVPEGKHMTLDKWKEEKGKLKVWNFNPVIM